MIYRLIEDACIAPTSTKRDAIAVECGLVANADSSTMKRWEQPDFMHMVTWPSLWFPFMKLEADSNIGACTVEKTISTGGRDRLV